MARLNKLPPHVRPEGEELQKLRERVKRLETTDMELYGDGPFDPIRLYDELLSDYENAFAKYYEKRIRLRGIVSKVGADSFGAPSFEMTDADGSRCYALIVFPTTDIYEQVREGQVAEIIGNVVFIYEPYVLVVKKCELLNVEDNNKQKENHHD